MADRVVIPIVFDAETGQATVAAKDLDKLGRQAEGASGSMSTLKKAFVAAFAVETLRRIGVYTQRLFDLGTAAEETASKFATVFGPATEALDARLRDLANRAGLTQTEIRGLTATAGAVAQGMGMGQAASADLAAEMIELSADITSFSNVSGGAEQVMQALTSALTGEREALKTLGIVLSEADVKQRQAERAAEGHADALTDQGKAAATLELITEKAGVAVGDLGRTQDSTANTARRLSAEVREQEERFARLNTVTFNYVLKTVAGLIRQNDEAAKSFADRLARGVLYTVGALTEVAKAGVRVVRSFSFLGESVNSLGGTRASGFGYLIEQLDGTLQQMKQVELASLYLAKAVAFADKVFEGVFGDPKAAEDAEALFRRIGGEIEKVRFELDALKSGESGIAATTAALSEEFEAFADGLDDLPDPGLLADDLLNDLIGAIEDGSDWAAKAREKAAEKAEQQRREAQDREFDNRQLQIEAMREGLAREIAEIDLAFDERREAFRRGYGALTATEAAAFERLQNQRKIQAAASAFSASGSASGRGVGDARGRDEVMAAFDEAAMLREAVEDVGVVATRTADQTAVSLADIANNYGDAIGFTLGALSGLFAEAGKQGGAMFEVSKGLAIAEAIVSTYVAANRALAEGGPVLGPILAAGMVASGLANVARIRSTSPGDSGGAGASTGRARPARSPGGASTVAAGLAIGYGNTAGARQGASAPVVNVGGPTVNPTPVNVQVMAGPQGLYAVVKEGEGQVARRRGTSPGL